MRIIRELLMVLVLSLLSIQAAFGQVTYSNVSGHIDGAGGEIVYLYLRKAGDATVLATILSDSSGNYTFYGLAGGDYTIQPALGPEYEFTPGIAAVSPSGTHITGVDFVVQPDQPGARIFGTIFGPAAVGTTITLGTDPQKTTLTDSAGYYVFVNIPAGTYSLEPSLTGCTFSSGNPSGTVTIISQEYDRAMADFISLGDCNILFIDSFE